jgi:predicted nuclease of predicted toxin-antitoxin system
VKFLIDNNLSPLLADALKAAGHDAVHLRDLGMQAATDHIVLEHARADERILVSADTDFGGLLARSGAGTPSVILIRRLSGRRAAEQAAIILANLDQVAEDLTAGPSSSFTRTHSVCAAFRCPANRDSRSDN